MTIEYGLVTRNEMKNYSGLGRAKRCRIASRSIGCKSLAKRGGAELYR